MTQLVMLGRGVLGKVSTSAAYITLQLVDEAHRIVPINPDEKPPHGWLFARVRSEPVRFIGAGDLEFRDGMITVRPSATEEMNYAAAIELSGEPVSLHIVV